MEKKGWKTIAIIFIILFICSLGFIGWLFHTGQQYELKNQICAYQICDLRGGEHDSYFYTDIDDSCFCFNRGELDFIEDVERYMDREGI